MLREYKNAEQEGSLSSTLRGSGVTKQAGRHTNEGTAVDRCTQWIEAVLATLVARERSRKELRGENLNRWQQALTVE